MKKFAQSQGAKRVFLQIDPADKVLLSKISKKLSSRGDHPFYIPKYSGFFSYMKKGENFPVFEL